jgi:hypothetical protein
MRTGPKSLLPALVAVWILAAPAPAAADGAASDAARQQFRAGVAYLEDPEGARYEDAYAAFKKAYELSKSPKILGNVGLCAMKLERDGEAIEAYRRYLQEVPDIDPEERAQIEGDLPTLIASAVHVKISLDIRLQPAPKTLVLSDTRLPTRGASVLNVYKLRPGQTELVLRPGQHRLAISSDGQAHGSWDVATDPGTSLAHTFVIDEAPAAGVATPARVPHSSPSRVGPLLLLGIGSAGLVAGGVLGAVTLGKVHDLNQQCPNTTCSSPNYRADVESARGFVRATDFVLLGGGLVAVTGLGWLLLMPSSEQDAPLQTNATCGFDGCGASMRVRF